MWSWYYQMYESNAKLSEKTAIITGANCGIGLQTAKDFYKRGANIIILCRDETKSLNAIKEIKEECKSLSEVGSLRFKYLDLNELSSVRRCAAELLDELERIHILVNNAGIFCHPERWSADGFEKHLSVNYLGHALLTLMLLPIIIRSAPSRIINVSSVIANLPLLGKRINVDDLNFRNRTYLQTWRYSQSKLANIIFTKHLSRKLKDAGIENVTTYSLHPGIIATGLGRNFSQYCPGLSWLWNNLSGILLATPERGAQTTIYCAVDEKLSNESGLFYSNLKVTEPTAIAFDQEIGENLWKKTFELLDLQDYDPFQKLQ